MSRLVTPRPLLVMALVALVAYPVIRPYDSYPQVVLLLAFLLATQAVGWNIISGYAGYVSLGHSVFLGLGSYTAGIVGAKTGLNPFLLAPLGGLVAVAAALPSSSRIATRPVPNLVRRIQALNPMLASISARKAK